MKIGGGFHLLFEMLGIDKENAETAQKSRRSNKSGGGGEQKQNIIYLHWKTTSQHGLNWK